jgi:hypothetical protein
MAYQTFENLPLYFGRANSSTLPTDTEGTTRKVSANQVQFSYTPSLTAGAKLGKSRDADDVLLSGPPNVSLSFSTLLQTGSAATVGEFSPFDYSGKKNGTNGCAAIIGSHDNGIRLQNLFLSSVTLTVAPYSPVIATCDFVGYTPPNTSASPLVNKKLNAETDTDTKPNPKADEVINGLFCSFSGSHGGGNAKADRAFEDATVFESLNYTASFTHTPIYTVGNYTATAHLTSAEHSLQVQADQIDDLIPVSGRVCNLILDLRNGRDDDFHTINVSGVMNGENVSISAGDVARAQLTVTAPLE